jgi:formamidopyrimidine-DNA glycosylase
MPELPETETIARRLDASVRGRGITGAVVEKGDVLREVTPDELARRTAGAIIGRCWRRAKLVVLDLSSGDRIVVQPRFTGALLLEGGAAGALPERERRFSTLHFTLDDGRRLHYRDIRRLGTVALMTPERWAEYEGALGVEPLGPIFSAERLSGIFRGSRQAVKKVLMDQRRIVGLGNIYANESLWRAAVDPSRPASSLAPDEVARVHDAIVGVLAESIAVGGTSFRDYVGPTGERGRFVERLDVFGRTGQPCHRCGTPLTGSHDVDGRSTVWCARCQK